MIRRSSVKTTLRQKIKLLILGICLFFVVLELGLRFGGFVISSVQAWRNNRGLSQKPQYKILCLGESTTAIGGATSYPAQLENILNDHNKKFRFAVINKGVIGTKTKIIVKDLEYNLNKYKPDMVITMMGINDNDGYIIYGRMPNSKLKRLFGELRVYKLFYLTRAHIEAKLSEILANKSGDAYLPDSVLHKETPIDNKEVADYEEKLRNLIRNNPVDFNSYFELGQLYMSKGMPEKVEALIKEYIGFNPKDHKGYKVLSLFSASQGNLPGAMAACKKTLELNPKDDKLCADLGNLLIKKNADLSVELFNKALEINPKSDAACLGLGWYYLNQNNIIQAQEYFLRASRINPGNDNAYAGLGWCYRIQFDSDRAEAVFRKAIRLNPRNDSAYAGLGWCYINRAELFKAEGFLKTAIMLNPKSEFGYNGLGWIYLQHGDVKGAIAIVEKGLKRMSRSNFGVYLTLGWYYLNTKQYSQAEESFLKAVELNPTSERPYLSLAKLYEDAGNHELAKKYRFKSKEIRDKQDYSETISNYLRLKEILGKEGIKLICVQYPMRSLEPLKNIFSSSAGMTFVDNEKIFKDAVEKDGYLAYFFDMFAGDFGHCTPKGNKLLAENISYGVLSAINKN